MAPVLSGVSCGSAAAIPFSYGSVTWNAPSFRGCHRNGIFEPNFLADSGLDGGLPSAKRARIAGQHAEPLYVGCPPNATWHTCMPLR